MYDVLVQAKNPGPHAMHLACQICLCTRLAFMRCAGYPFIDKEGDVRDNRGQYQIYWPIWEQMIHLVMKQS
jgi:hypothetical protein